MILRGVVGALALVASIAPGATAVTPIGFQGIGSCPGVQLHNVSINAPGNLTAHVIVRGEVCLPDRSYPFEIDEWTPEPLPLVVPGVPTGNVALRDSDGDGVPVASVERGTLVVHGDGTFEFRDVREEPLGVVDPDDDDPDNPLPSNPPGARVSARAGCERDAVCVTATVRGTPVDRDVDQHVSVAIVTDAIYGESRLRPLEIQRDVVVVNDAPEEASTRPRSGSRPQQGYSVGAATVRAPCPGPGSAASPEIDLKGLVNQHVMSYSRNELPPVAVVRCAITALWGGVAVPVPPVEAPPR